MLNSALILLFPILMAFTAAYDLLTMRIPNWITLALIGGFLVLAFYVGMPLNDIGFHLGVGAIVLVVAFLLFIPGWIGGGDAKVAAAIGLWMGTANVLEFLVYSAFLGGVLTLALLFFRNYVPDWMVPNWTWLKRLHNKSVGAPYGIALAIGAMLVYTQSAIFLSLG